MGPSQRLTMNAERSATVFINPQIQKLLAKKSAQYIGYKCLKGKAALIWLPVLTHTHFPHFFITIGSPPNTPTLVSIAIDTSEAN